MAVNLQELADMVNDAKLDGVGALEEGIQALEIGEPGIARAKMAETVGVLTLVSGSVSAKVKRALAELALTRDDPKPALDEIVDLTAQLESVRKSEGALVERVNELEADLEAEVVRRNIIKNHELGTQGELERVRDILNRTYEERDRIESVSVDLRRELNETKAELARNRLADVERISAEAKELARDVRVELAEHPEPRRGEDELTLGSIKVLLGEKQALADRLTRSNLERDAANERAEIFSGSIKALRERVARLETIEQAQRNELEELQQRADQLVTDIIRAKELLDKAVVWDK